MGNSVLDAEATVSKLELARSYILDAISDEPAPAKEIIGQLSRLGVGLRTVESAKKELGVKSYRIGSAWFWALEEIDTQKRGVK